MYTIYNEVCRTYNMICTYTYISSITNLEKSYIL